MPLQFLAEVVVTERTRADGKPDRQVELVAQDGHRWQLGIGLKAGLPSAGEVVECLGCVAGERSQSEPSGRVAAALVGQQPSKRRSSEFKRDVKTRGSP